MRCTNKINCVAVSLILLAGTLSGCGKTNYDFAYDPNYEVSSFRVVKESESNSVRPFAADLCIASDDYADDLEQDRKVTVTASAAGLFDINHSETIVMKSPHEKLYPASLTKVMTTLVALKHASKDKVLTATENVNITESGATLCGVKAGDTMTLDQALHILMLHSANDAAVMIAEGIAGTVDNFVNMMNEEALALGATNTHFTNPHGLSDENHYTTAYDLYLIFNEAVKYESFKEIISLTSYSTTYKGANGADKELSYSTTNWFLNGNAQAPDNVTVIGGKTGTTNAARNCLILLSKDTSGNPYISVLLRSETRDILYEEMIELLNQIKK